MNGLRLSEPQFATLAIAYKRRKVGRQHRCWYGNYDVSTTDLKHLYYDFPLCPQGRSLFFRVREIGPARYRSAGSAIVKTFDRLCERGLAERCIGGLLLTEAGIDVAEKLLALHPVDWLDDELR